MRSMARRIGIIAIVLVTITSLAAVPAAAQPAGEDPYSGEETICDSGLMTLLQSAADLIVQILLPVGAIIGVGSHLGYSYSMSKERRKKFKKGRDNAIVKGMLGSVVLLYVIKLFMGSVIGVTVFSDCLTLPIVG